MSTTYSTVPGDTFGTIARKQYGTDLEALRIARANPGTVEPLAPGTVLIVPLLPGAPADRIGDTIATGADEVAVLISGKRFRFWDRVRITRSIDAVDSVTFGAPFDPDAPGFREAFRPFAFRSLGVTVGGEPLFTGTLITASPELDAPTVLSASGYSLPGVLNDCTPPASAFPLEFNKQNLSQIAEALAAPFGLSVEFAADPGPVFERIACEPGTKIITFLAGLAKQRNLVISSTPRGALLFWRSVEAGSPIAQLEQGSSPLLSVMPAFNTQQYYSHLTGLGPVTVGDSGGTFTSKNPRLEGIIRPLTFTPTDAENADLAAAVGAKFGRMFGAAVGYTLKVATWRDPVGLLWTPNTTLTLTAPGAMIYNPYEFIIRSVTFERDRASEVATLDLVLPGSFSGEIPEALPWD